MTQALYAHMNNKTIKEKKKRTASRTSPLSEWPGALVWRHSLFPARVWAEKGCHVELYSLI
jgi:hypothetical protein